MTHSTLLASVRLCAFEETGVELCGFDVLLFRGAREGRFVVGEVR